MTEEFKESKIPTAEECAKELDSLRKVFGKYFFGSTLNSLVLSTATLLEKDSPIVIDGIQEMTGQSNLCSELKKLGYNAIEAWKAEKIYLNKNYYGIIVCVNNRTIPQKRE